MINKINDAEGFFCAQNGTTAAFEKLVEACRSYLNAHGFLFTGSLFIFIN